MCRSWCRWRGPQAWPALARARERLLATELFEAHELDFAALAAAAPSVTVLQPAAREAGVSAQLPVRRAAAEST